LSCGKFLLVLIPTLLLMISSRAGQAWSEPYYTWVDEDGVTNFSQRIPRGVDADFVSESRAFGIKKPVSQQDDPPGSATDSEAGQAPGDDVDMDKERQAVKDEMARVRASNCDIGKRNLAKLQAYARIRVRGGDGGERVLTDEEKQRRIRSAQKTIKENCGSA
jgi:hypothetical protein